MLNQRALSVVTTLALAGCMAKETKSVDSVATPPAAVPTGMAQQIKVS